MKGGSIKGQGGYGCVFQPALLCKGSKNPTDPKKVGKITDYVDAKNEVAFGKYFSGIQDSSKYVIFAEATTCTPRSRRKQVEKDLELCKIADKEPLDTMVQIIMPFGGYSISRMNLDPSEFNFINTMEQILEIGTFLILNDVCHFDMNVQNILFDGNKKPRAIDFGFAFRPTEFTKKDMTLRWRVMAFDHDTESPEVTLMLAAHDNIGIEESLAGLKQQKPAVQNLASICHISPDAWAADLRNWTQTSQSFMSHDWESCWKTYWPGFDAWSIGAMLLTILDIQLRFSSFVESEAWKTKGDKIKKILIGLCRAHPAYRIDAAEALAYLTDGKHPLISNDGSGNISEGYAWIQEKKARRQFH
jgi:hypothetical protein